MKTELLKYSLQNLWNRKTRSLLTILSILIGITAIFTLVSFGYGIENYVDTLAKEAGIDKLFVQAKGMGAPGTDSNFYISEDDLEFIQKTKGVAKATGMYVKVIEAEYKGERIYTFAMGADPKENDFVQESFGIDMIEGRELKTGELSKVGLGYNFLFEDKIFKRRVELNDKIYLNGVPFDVTGFASEIGNPADDANIYLTKEGFETLYPDTVGKYAFVMASSEPGVDTQELAERLSEKLRKHKGLEEGEEDFYIQTFEDAISTFTSIIGVINGVLFLIAMISVIVAAVNIMNTMYTSVLERTNEIGIMKAIGARNKDIGTIFVLESGILGLIGGILGIILGFIFSSIGGATAAAYGYSLLKPAYPLSLILRSLFFSIFIGAVSGLLPAIQASKLKPVDALRYE